MEAFLVGMLFILLFFMSFFYLKRTPLEISVCRSGFAGILLFREMLGLIALAAVILNYYSPSDFHGFRNTSKESVFYISLVVFYALFMFVLFSGGVLKLLFRGVFSRSKASLAGKEVKFHGKEYEYIVRLGVVLALAGLFVSFLGIFMYGARHAFIASLISGESLLSVRLANTNVANMPTVFNSFMGFCFTFLVVVMGGVSYKRSRKLFLFFIASVLYLATFGGAKAPLVNSVIIYLVSHASFMGFRVKAKTFISIIVSMFMLAALIYFVVWVQMGVMTFEEFFIYILNRLGVGQMAGVYEQFNLKIRSLSYVWHAVPFAGFFSDYPVFQKDLMLASEFVNDAASTGVKNSLFVSEAYAFGGPFLVAFSPAIVGINYSISMYAFYYVVQSLFLRNELVAMKVSGLFFVAYFSLTGGFSEWLFFKALIMVLMFMLPIYIVFRFVGGVPIIRFFSLNR